jgi:hypothetical protein
MKLHLGIDIGVDQSGALQAIHDMPVLHDGPKGRRAINAPLLASIIFKSHADHAFIEGVGARPGEGAVRPGKGRHRRRSCRCRHPCDLCIASGMEAGRRLGAWAQ